MVRTLGSVLHVYQGTICFRCAGPAADDGRDFTGRPYGNASRVLLPVDTDTVYCEVDILEDEQREGDQVFIVRIDAVSCGGSVGPAINTTIIITDNDGTLILNILSQLLVCSVVICCCCFVQTNYMQYPL